MSKCIPRCAKRKNRREKGRISNPEPATIFIDQTAPDGSSSSSLEITMAEFLSATDNFSSGRIVGVGRLGTVYRARLPTGATVAVKRLRLDSRREFHAEMDSLCKLRHPNIVKILGFFSTSTARPDLVVIYEFVDNGSLRRRLHHQSPPLDWDRRVKIARGVAEGLRYLHGLETPIVHRAISSSNVLLGARFEARIADFGLARMIAATQSHVTTEVAGATAYMAPEYLYGGVVATTKRADVYSFGILMLEIATGREPNVPVLVAAAGGRRATEEVALVHWVRWMVAEGREMEMVDATVAGGKGGRGLREAEVTEFFRIACMCASDLVRERPAMNDVANLLDKLQCN